MDIVLIGAGRVAGAFAPFLMKMGSLRIWNRTFENASILAKKVGAIAISDPTQVKGDFAFVAVSDKALRNVAEQFSQSFTVALHTSGFHPSSVIEPMAHYVGSLHPWLPIPEQDHNLLVNALATFEGNREAEQIAAELASIVPLRLHRIDSQKKTTYHTAAVLLSNYVDVLMIKGGELLQEAGVTPAYDDDNDAPSNEHSSGELDAEKLFVKEIVETTLRNYLKLGKDSLTGPAVRKDMEVIDAEASTLSEKWSLVYRLLAEIIMEGGI